jgi:hypothetical protein
MINAIIADLVSAVARFQLFFDYRERRWGHGAPCLLASLDNHYNYHNGNSDNTDSDQD